jgi:hypothetical protein
MFKQMILIISAIFLVVVSASAQEKPALVVHVFTVPSGVTFPYDMSQLQSQTIAELKDKDGTQFDFASEVPGNQARVFVLNGEVIEWHKGNTAERMLIAMGSVAGRENAKIHYWLTDKDGKKVFEHTDTIRQTFMENGHEKSTGTLARPFAAKVAERLKGAKLAPEGVPGE